MAIVGLGTDIVEIARIAQQDARSDKLARRVLTANELQIYQQQKFRERYLAKRFAAKEAAVKALGTGIGNGVSWQQLEVFNADNGQPFLAFGGYLWDLCAQRGITHCHLSISDEQRYAVATVVFEALDGPTALHQQDIHG